MRGIICQATFSGLLIVIQCPPRVDSGCDREVIITGQRLDNFKQARCEAEMQYHQILLTEDDRGFSTLYYTKLLQSHN